MNTTITISNQDCLIISDDVIARIEDLREQVENYDDMPDGDMLKDTLESQAARDELKILEELAKDGADYSADWKYGVELIRDSYFKEYAMELAEEFGAVNDDTTWPHNCIDWDKAARELQYDYSSIEFDGVTYWLR